MKQERKLEVVASDTAGMTLDELFSAYVAICNQAVTRHHDKFPYRELLAAGQKLLGERLHIAVYDDTPEAVYALTFKDKEFTHAPDSSLGTKKAWRMNKSYLRKVVEHPERYIDHPGLLDLDWLKNRMGF